tara:strand:- start:521 stop:1423 length:903 start_codon:yes stop_codon:yes gene_type:complete
MLPHGIIISGPVGIGKKILAKKISKDLLENKNNKSDDINPLNHPDLFILEKDKILLHHITYREDKWDDEKGQRNVNDFLSVTPSIAINKVALIFNAQTMNKAAQNALLKSLEEPAPNTYIIITTDRPKSLYETIYSRCQVINIPNISQSTIDEWLIKNGISDINSNDFPSFSTPLSILNDIQNDEHHNFKNFINIISEYVENKTDLNLTIKNISSLEINLVTKANYLIEFLKILLKSNLLSEDLSGLYKKYNSSKFNNLKISNLINELNNFRYDYFKVPQINETHVLNYFLSEVKNSIRI